MSSIIQHIITPSWRPQRAAIAGLAATVAYSIAMEGDMSLTGSRFSDVRFIEGLLPGRDQSRSNVWLLGWIIHLRNGALLGELYAALSKLFLPGPNLLKGGFYVEFLRVAALRL